MTRTRSTYLALVAVLLSPMAANADLIGADIDITAENGFSSGSSICKTGAALGVTVGGGDELAAADWTGGCVGYYSADVTGSQIILTGIESGNYSFASFFIQVLSGPSIAGVTFDGYTPNFFGDFYPNNDSNFLPTISFGSDFISIVWDTFDDASQFLFNGPENVGQEPFGSAFFSVSTASVPEPGTIGLLGIGLAAIGIARRRRKD